MLPHPSTWNLQFTLLYDTFWGQSAQDVCLTLLQISVAMLTTYPKFQVPAKTLPDAKVCRMAI